MAIDTDADATERTRAVLEQYLSADHNDASTIADDAVFTIMATGEEYRGPEAILGMLTYFYHVAFDAKAERRTVIVEGNQAFTEWDFVGRHIGDFNGIPATGKDVRVPLAVAYDIGDDKVKAGRVYFEIPALLKQLGIG